MTRRITATEARVRFGDVLRRVTEADETVVVEKSGRPAAVVVSIAAYERLRSAAEHKGPEPALERAGKLRERMRKRLGGRPIPAPEDLIAEDRRVRDEQLWTRLR